MEVFFLFMGYGWGRRRLAGAEGKLEATEKKPSSQLRLPANAS